MTPEQCIAARRLLEWSQADLEREACVALVDIMRFELNFSDISEDIIASIETTFEYAGINFNNSDEIEWAGTKIRIVRHE